MLRQRVLTAVVLAPLVVWLVLFASNQVLALAMILVISLAAYEWAMLCGLQTLYKLVFSLILTTTMAIMLWLLQQQSVDFSLFMWPIAILWGGLTFWLVLQRKPLQLQAGIDYVGLMLGAAFLLVAWLSVVQIHAIELFGSQLLMILMLLIWTADTLAYFSGRLFGRHKLSPQVSPGKTWEGVAGGLLGVALLGLLLGYHDFFQHMHPVSLVVLVMLVAMVSVGGDLFESRIKRVRGEKDSGHILPGHGGIYDRIDSLVAAAPVYLLGLSLLSDGIAR